MSQRCPVDPSPKGRDLARTVITKMADADFQRRAWIMGILLVVAAGAGVWFLQRPTGESGPVPPRLPDLSSTEYLNTKADAVATGSERCIGCHANEHRSYLATSHSRAFGEVVVDQEPGDGSFHHEKSGRDFRVRRSEGEVHHQELLRADDDHEETVLCDFPVRFAVGSGNNARTYLVEVDGFLAESPITWYASQKAWGPSPGYDKPDHVSFSRPIDVECLNCHVGRIDPESKPGHPRFLEHRIGCENCHGRGSLHVEAHSAGAKPAGRDRTIVNPARLSRELNESVCAQCHLEGTAMSLVRGRNVLDFRPGLPLTDVRIDYVSERPDPSMKVTGHFEQMYASRCYTQSESLTCTTCHNPHGTPAPGREVEHYRTICLSCHGDGKGCRLPSPERLKQSAADDCTVCHMPRTSVQVPHLVFTRHRIGLQAASESPAPPPVETKLVPIRTNKRLHALDQDRCLALAALDRANSLGEEEGRVERQRSFALLEKVYAGGIRDSKVVSSLAWMHWERQSKKFLPLAQEALSDPACTPESRVNAMMLLAAANLQKRNAATARDVLEDLVGLNLNVTALGMLGDCRARTGDLDGAIEAYRRSLEILPDQAEARERLVGLYKKSGQPDLAAQHRKILDRLERSGSRPSSSP